MSLLLDALHRASKDKEKAALAVANAAAADTSQLPPPKKELLEPPIKPSEPITPQPAPSVVEPKELELEMEPKPLVPPPPERVKEVESPPVAPSPAPVETPPPASNPLPKTPPPAEPLTGAAASPSSTNGVNRSNQATTQSAKPAAPANAQAAANAIQNAYATPPSANRPRSRRVLILGGVATCLALGLGSFLLGLWGDPERLLGLTGTSSVAIVSPPVPMPTASTVTMPVAPPVAAAVPTPADTAMVPLTAVPPVGNAAALDASTNTVAAPNATATRPPVSADTTTSTPRPMVTRPSTTQPKELVLPPTSGAPVFSSKTTSQGGLEQAYAALVEGRLDDAALAYGAALSTNPLEADALLGLAYIAHSKGRREEAQTLYRKVLRLDPSNSVANAGLIALEAGTNGSTKSDRAKALAANQPDSAAAQALAASALVQDGLVAEAALAFGRAQALEPTNPWHSFNLAVALDKLSNYAQAAEQYDRALQNVNRSPTPLGSKQVESARARAAQLRQSMDSRSDATK